MKLGIIGAMEIEVAALKENMENKSEKTVAGSVYVEGTLEGLSVVIVQCGVGKVNAALCVQVLCDCFQVTHIVNTGVAGSLNAELDIGDFVISKEAVYHDFDCSTINPKYALGQVPGMEIVAFPSDDLLIRLASAAAKAHCSGRAHVGIIATGDQFVASKEQKERIIKNTNALCTEMEGAAISQAAYRNGIPVVVIRAISDKADNTAWMDYAYFEAIAARQGTEVVRSMAKSLSTMQ